MADFIKYAEEMALRDRTEATRVRTALIDAAAVRVPTGMKLIRDVALSTSTDISTVQEEYWNLLHSGKLRLAEGTAVEST